MLGGKKSIMGGSIVLLEVQRHHSQGLCRCRKNFPNDGDVTKSKISTAAQTLGSGVVGLVAFTEGRYGRLNFKLA